MKMIEMLKTIGVVIKNIIDLWNIIPTPRTSGEGYSSTKERRRIVQGVRKFFEQNYELRYNVMKQTEEYRPLRAAEATYAQQKAPFAKKEAPNFQEEPSNFQEEAPFFQGKAPFGEEKAGSWQPLTDRKLRQMAIEQMEQVGVAWSIDVELYVRSALVPLYNPVTAFLDSCPAWDGCDHIRQAARRVPTAYDRWPDHFHRWLLAVVAQWLNLSHDYGNAVVPMLIGQQGTHKSTFCRMLLPPELREYYIDDVKLDAAEQVERMLCRMLLVNIDEYNAKTDREQAKIKRLLTEKDVQTRRMRSDQYELRPRMASFIATTNDLEPLCDISGSRRYLCCEVTGSIDTDSPWLHRQMYAQALHELRHGERWHYTKEEETEIVHHNQAYQRQSSPEEVLLSFFKPAHPDAEHFMRAVDIQKVLRQHVRMADVPSLKALTLALKSAHFAYGRHQRVRGWYAEQL